MFLPFYFTLYFHCIVESVGFKLNDDRPDGSESASDDFDDESEKEEINKLTSKKLVQKGIMQT